MADNPKVCRCAGIVPGVVNPNCPIHAPAAPPGGRVPDLMTAEDAGRCERFRVCVTAPSDAAFYARILNTYAALAEKTAECERLRVEEEGRLANVATMHARLMAENERLRAALDRLEGTP